MFIQSAGIVILTYNSELWALKQIEGLKIAGATPDQILVIDSSSKDRTRDHFEAYGATVQKIIQSDFNHGGTRRLGAEYFREKDFLIFLTHDAIPCNVNTFTNLLFAFHDPVVGMAYGRQLPRPGAGTIEIHARLYNYPQKSNKVSYRDRARVGTKATFASDSFAAYRSAALFKTGSFPEDTFFGEDQIVSAKMLIGGFTKAYVADAHVYHSHSYTLAEDFRRSFDVGVFHSHNRWLMDRFGKPEGEGLRFVKSELRFVLKHSPLRLVEVMLRTLLKYAGYKMGKQERRLPFSAKRKFSASPYYWTAEREASLSNRVNK